MFSADGSGNMDFNDFVSMASTFSDAAPANVKTEYAFEIYGNSSLYGHMNTKCLLFSAKV